MSSPQIPLGSGFSAYSTSLDVIRSRDLVGRLAVVTGGHAGLGLEVARTLASAGARVIVPARDVERARQAVSAVGGGIEVRRMDLTDPASIHAFATDVVQSGLALHLLVNNAGIMALPRLERDARGFELQFSTNHLGHFQLTKLLWPALARAQGARVVSVSSLGHHLSDIDWGDINFERRAYDGWVAYGQSKTANALFAVEVDRRGRDLGIRAFSLHPGGVVTGLARYMSVGELQQAGHIDQLGRPVIDPARDMKSVAQGAATILWCAVSEQLNGRGGVFCIDADIASVDSGEMSADGRRVYGVAPYAIDGASALRLWELSEGMSGARGDD